MQAAVEPLHHLLQGQHQVQLQADLPAVGRGNSHFQLKPSGGHAVLHRERNRRKQSPGNCKVFSWNKCIGEKSGKFYIEAFIAVVKLLEVQGWKKRFAIWEPELSF